MENLELLRIGVVIQNSEESVSLGSPHDEGVSSIQMSIAISHCFRASWLVSVEHSIISFQDLEVCVSLAYSE